MLLRILFCLIIEIFVVFPCVLLSLPVVALLLLTGWSGRTTIFGNWQWGRGTLHPAHATVGYWQQFDWLVIRNPVVNLQTEILGKLVVTPAVVYGDADIGDKIAGGFYIARMGNAWEYYWIYPYSKSRCVRARIGWKLTGKTVASVAPFCFDINPFMAYSGV